MQEENMNIIVHIARVVLGLIFIVFGPNGFFNVLPVPEGNAAAQAFLGAVIDTGYLFYLVKAIETLGAILLLTNRCVPFAIVLLAPVVVNIFLYNTLLDSSGWWMGTLLLTCNLILAVGYRHTLAGIFTVRATMSRAR
jgi:putative oxidoreductase